MLEVKKSSGTWSSKEAMSCIFYKALIFQKQKDYESSEAFYLDAIAGFNALREIKHQLKSQLFLSDFYRSLGRDSEALHLLLETLIGHVSTMTRSTELFEVISSIQQVHATLKQGGTWAHVPTCISQIQSLIKEVQEQAEWDGHLNWHLIWFHFAEIGGAYSFLSEFENADLCFGFVMPPISTQLAKDLGEQSASTFREYAQHLQRQRQWLNSLQPIQDAFRCLKATSIPCGYPLVVHLEALLATAKKPTLKYRQKYRLFHIHERAWGKADLAREEFLYSRVTAKEEVPVYRLLTRRTPGDCGRRENRREVSGKSSVYSESSSSRSSTSYKYGLTYSVGSLSVISDSEFMVP